MCTDLCMECVEGRISDEIVTSQRVSNCKEDCPHSCQDDIVCSNCCNCLIGVSGVPVCKRNVCICLVIPPIGQINNVPSLLPIIANWVLWIFFNIVLQCSYVDDNNMLNKGK
jgi:hypothetical protein